MRQKTLDIKPICLERQGVLDCWNNGDKDEKEDGPFYRKEEKFQSRGIMSSDDF